MINFLLGLLGSIIEFSGLDPGLNTKKIDKNILYLQQYKWFQDLYNDDKYRKLFITNYKIRSYLQSTIRIRLLVNNKTRQKQFCKMLDLQIKKNLK
ncbi:hypothetical protein COM21_25750 [Bacillus toyonensis]|uniref:hypothetical protein n=1 Tax=Bacillus toyonensis TaxID=155322 RepID=UPI0002794CF2|nr:hypothetical protein [Bacillus toyonensis]KNH32501.1 hypothetical protein ACS75_28080 [Bacillus thuringiensis]EJQ73054.1 hypothetical protein IGK_05501 [Bacillus toyonensis]EJQ78679.1 hypothetical protein IGO_05487 [Bacillus toyonensis]EJV41859.1 hypothetical protein IEA_05487 [Bacillus toyonensis]EJV89962.1 hypothetical protein IGI_05606 [Bacillus toyonensis]